MHCDLVLKKDIYQLPKRWDIPTLNVIQAWFHIADKCWWISDKKRQWYKKLQKENYVPIQYVPEYGKKIWFQYQQENVRL